jgi:putative glycosyltransferase (TIGR04372 family)
MNLSENPKFLHTINQIKSLPPRVILKRGLAKFVGIFLVKPIFLPVALLLHIFNYRYVNIFTDRIGHLAIEPDTLIKAELLGIVKPRKWILLSPSNRTANTALLEYWRRYFIIISNPLLCFLIRYLSWPNLMRFDCNSYIRNIHGPQESYKIQKAWGDRKPLLSLSDTDQVWAAKKFKQLGIPPESWFVCIHAREPGFSKVDDEIQAYRNSSVANLLPSIHEITRRGGWVVRLGEKSSSKLPAIPQTIDYAHHHLKCDQLDLILCAKAKFILGNTSGINFLGTIFGTPCAAANLAPISTLLFTHKDISIFKILFSEIENKIITYQEAMNINFSVFQFNDLYKKNKIRLIENSAEDILLLTCEMFRIIDNDLNRNLEHHKLSKHQISNILKKYHYAWGSDANIARFFILKYKNIIFNDVEIK